MSLTKPFKALTPSPERAQEVVAPPYDVVDRAQATEFTQGKHFNFLHISKPEIDLPEQINPSDHQVYEQGAKTLSKLLQEQILTEGKKPAYYVYRISVEDHQQTGLAAAISVEAYQATRIRKHELTRPEKQHDRAAHLLALKAHISPVMLAYDHQTELNHLLEKLTAQSPLISVSHTDGSRHELWPVTKRNLIKTITDLVDSIDYLYIADGHHRSAASYEVYSDPLTGIDAAYFLGVMFPMKQLKILGYHRLIANLNGLTTEGFLESLRDCFAIMPSDHAVKPQDPHQFGLYLERQWYQLAIVPELAVSEDIVARLPVSLLTKHVIEPILGIVDQRRDKNIDFIGGLNSLKEIESLVDNDKFAAGFTLYPTTMGELKSIADSHAIVPPKSTWFEPKLLDGLVSYRLG